MTCDLDSYELVGIGKALKAGFDRVVVACEDEKLIAAMRGKLDNDSALDNLILTTVNAVACFPQ